MCDKQPLSRRGIQMTNNLRLALSTTITALVITQALGLAWALGAFELEDQLERRHTKASVFRGEHVIIVSGAQRDHQEPLVSWVTALERQGGARADVYGIVNLEALPFFVPRSSVRGKLAEMSSSSRIMLDYEGEAWRTLGFDRKKSIQIIVYDESGTIISKRSVGARTSSGVNAILSAIP